MATGFQRQVQNLAKTVRGNHICVECDRANPTWASTNLGVFLCLDCSGIHRSLGTHISKVKSTTLDKWDAHLVEAIERTGNTRSREYWEANMPPTLQRPTNMQQRATFIRDKYVNKRYIPFEGQATTTRNDRTHRQSLDGKPVCPGKKKRIPPSQRRKLQQQQKQKHQEIEEGKRQVNVEAVPDVASALPAAKEKDRGGGSLFSNLSIKRQSNAGTIKDSSKANKDRSKIMVWKHSNNTDSGADANVVKEEANLLHFNIQDHMTLRKEDVDINKKAFTFDATNMNMVQNNVATVPATHMPSAIHGVSSLHGYHQSFTPPSRFHQVEKPVDTTGKYSDIRKKLAAFERQLADAETTLMNAQESLRNFVKARENFLASKMQIEILSGQVDAIQMSGLDALELHKAEQNQDKGEIESLKSLRKRLNQKATNIAQVLVQVHNQLTNEGMKP